MVKKRSLFLYPLSWLYSIIIGFRNFLFEYKLLPIKEFKTPVICIGNITVGGTGKTPHTEYLIRLLKDKFNIAVLSRGYKRKTNQFILADKTSTVNDIGDEPKQMAQKFPNIKVAVDKKRVRGIENLLKIDETLQVILLDDAFQHRYVKAGISILLIDYHRLIYEDSFLPYGNLRESVSEKDRADIIIISKTPNEIKAIEQRIIFNNLKLLPYQDLFFTTLKYGNLIPVFPDSKYQKNIDLEKDKKNILLLTGIANTMPLVEYLEKRHQIINHLTYPDHHFYNNNDVKKISSIYNEIKEENIIIITTEKDAVRLQSLQEVEDIINLAIYYLPIEIKFLDKNKSQFDTKIFNYVK